MMNANRQNSKSADTKSTPMWLRLGGLFVVASVVFFGAFFGYDLLSTFSEKAAARPANDAAPPIVIDPKIETDLAKALAFEEPAVTGDVKDPFFDRGNLSGKLANSTIASAQQSAAVTPGASGIGPISGSPLGLGSKGGNLTGGAPLSVVENTKQRYEKWIEQNAFTGAPLDPRIFSIEDLLPVGIVDGGNGQQEVMFFSEAADKTVSFPLGTLFYDGWLTELRPEGVIFSSSDRRTIRMRSWARSIKNAG